MGTLSNLSSLPLALCTSRITPLHAVSCNLVQSSSSLFLLLSPSSPCHSFYQFFSCIQNKGLLLEVNLMSWWLGGFWDSKNQTFILNTAVHISTHLLFTGKVVAWVYSAPIGGVPSRNWVLVTRLLVFPPRATTFNFPPSDPMARSHKNNQWWGHPRGFQLSPAASSDKARINSNVSAVCQKSLRSFDILGLMIRLRHQ